MMRKTILCIALLLGLTATLRAESPLRLGIKAGFSSQDQIFPSGQWIDHRIKDRSTGYHVGLVARLRVPLIGLYFQPELVYAWHKYHLYAGGDMTMREKVSTLDVPVLIGQGFGLGSLARIRLNLGPVFTVMTKAKITGLDWTTNLSRPTVGYTAGVGADLFGVLTLDVRYNGQFKKGAQDFITDRNGYTTATKFQGWMFSLGVLF